MGGEQEKSDIRIRGGAGRCPFCRDLVSDVRETVACAACGARHHAQCHTEHGACASCGATDVLVPRSRAGGVQRERPPRGSRIRVSESEDETEYSWTSAHGGQLALVIFMLACMVVTVPLIPIVIYYWLRYHDEPTRVRLRETHLEISTGGPLVRTKQVRARRKDVGAIRLTRLHQQGLRLTLDVGVERTVVASAAPMQALKEPEVEWLYERLLAWKEGT